MEIGLDYPILLHTPKEVQLTADQFNHLSVIGVSSFFCNYTFAIEKKEDCYEVTMKRGRELSYYESPRFKDINWYMDPDNDLVFCEIPLDNPLIETINKKFSHFILK